jgi:hypothetical protein
MIRTPEIFRYLDTAGDGSGTKEAIGDYSAGVDFKITAATASIDIYRMLVFIEDSGPLSADQYGNLAALTNGIEVKVKNAAGATTVDLTDGIPIKNNAGWARTCYDSTADDYGSGGNFVKVRWTFSASGQPLRIPVGHSFTVELSDNLTGLVEHTFMAQGKLSFP